MISLNPYSETNDDNEVSDDNSDVDSLDVSHASSSSGHIDDDDDDAMGNSCLFPGSLFSCCSAGDGERGAL